MRVMVPIAIMIGIAVLLALLPGRAQIAPLVESDYCYQLIAADRLAAGEGFTSLQPVAPGQPWEWEYDFGFLTQWPAGYSLLVGTVRAATGWTAIAVCRAIALAACAGALVGWFLWGRRVVPGGVTSCLAAAVTAMGAVSVASLTNPSTDVLLVAALPWVLLAAARAMDRIAPESLSNGNFHRSGKQRASAGAAPQSTTMDHRLPVRCSISWCMLAGLAAGGLCWIRYAAVFVPAGIGLFMMLMLVRGRVRGRQVLVYALGAALPMAGLLCMNRLLAPGTSVQAQLNLGQRIGFEFSWDLLSSAWWRLTDLGYYDYKPWLHWGWAAALPVGALVAAGLTRRSHGAIRGRQPALRFELKAAGHEGGREGAHHSVGAPAALSIMVLGTCLVMILAATALFGDKFNYVGLDRYYQPVRPLFVLLCLSPLVTVLKRWGRAALWAGLLLAGSWTVQQEWGRTYARWRAADRPTTPFGAWSRCFEPGASELYVWLRAQSRPSLVVVSNFHEFIAVETGMAVLPVPPDEATLSRWLKRIQAARGVDAVRVLFVLDPENRWRDYWLPDPAEVGKRFNLRAVDDLPETIAPYVFDYSPSSPIS